MEISRDEIYHEMIKIYSRKEIYEYSKVVILSKNEDAVGDGVARDVYALFFEKLYGHWFLSVSQKPQSRKNN